MRSTKLVSAAAAAAATTLALAPVVASARPAGGNASGPGGACHLRIEVPRGPITAEQPVTIFGQLKCPAEEATGKQVSLYEHAANKAGFALVGTPATTEKGGFYQFTPPPLNVNTVFYVIAPGARSAHRMIRVSPIVTLASPAEGTPLFTATGRQRKLHSVIFKGTVSPVEAGSMVAVQREDSPLNEEWHRVGDLGPINAKGEFEVVRNFSEPGVANLRVVVHPPRGLGAPGASTPTSFVFSQPQNPLLTIQTSVEPLSYAQSTTISGVVAGAADKTPVTLLARSRQGHFAAVESGQTVGSAYSFTQTPLHNTLYRVVSGAKTSALLVEGVKFVVTGAAPPSTLTAGKPVTFTGTVKGAKAGDLVYLERKAPSQVGYNISDISTLVAGANPGETTYSIEHAFYGPGESDIRVLVPGDGELQGKATEAANVTIAQAPASALRPEAPGNGKLPREGQF